MKALIFLFLFACLPLAAQDYLVWSKRYDYNVHDVRYSPDEKTVAVAHGDSISILSADDGRILRTIGTRPERFQIEQVIFAPDGNSIIVRYEEKKLIDEWNVNDGTLRESYLKDYQNVATINWLNHIDISPDGKHLAATFYGGSSNCIFVVIERATGKELLHKDDKEYGEVKYSHNSGTLALVRYSPRPRIELYDTKDYNLWTTSLDTDGTAKMAINDIDFSYNDSLLALVTTGGGAPNYAIWLLDMKTKVVRKPISTLGVPDAQRIKFYSDNKYILAGGGGSKMVSYSIEQPNIPYVFKDSLADYRGGRGIDCSLKDGNFISALSTTVVMSNNKWLSPVSAYENTVQSDSILFPNPASGHVTVKIPMMEGVPVQSSITDITGKQYRVHSTQSWEQGIRTAVYNVGILPAGKYFLRMEGSTGIYIFAFMKE